MMRILVCVKQVAHVYSPKAIDARGKIDPLGIVHMLNPYDELALEEALRIREGAGQGEVTLISLGPPRVVDALQYGLAMGADRAIHISMEKEKVPPRTTAQALVGAIQTCGGVDLVLCGKKSIDDNDGLVGGWMAEMLAWPYAMAVTGITVHPDGAGARMVQILDPANRQVLECDLPAVLSVEQGQAKPRYPTLPGRLGVCRKEIIRLAAACDLTGDGAPEPRFSRLSVSRPKPKAVFVPDSSLSVEERMALVMSGGVMEKKGSSAKGSPSELAEQFIRFLEENRLIRKRRVSR